ncbi:MAG: LemA family protein [Xanthomonadales bacterium]|nr:LemA family protein [Xanthomonadales bacterium]
MFWIILIIIALIFAAIVIYNKLIRQRNILAEAWAGIDVQLTRRFDLIPNLVELVKAYKEYEAGTLEEIVRLRADTNTPVQQRGANESLISGQIKKLIAVAEAYPDLKADKNFRQLHEALVEVEDHLQYARRYYNGAVRDNNILVESFPSNLLATTFGFKIADFFEIELASQRQAVEVSL